MVAPSLMFEHGIDVAKGWFEPSALDFATTLSADVTFDVPAGRIMHVNAAGEFATGVEDRSMGITLIQGSDAFDVANPGTTPSGNFMHQPIAPTGVMSGLVHAGAYEIENTEFDGGQVYAPNEQLTAVTANTTLATGGVLTNQSAVPYTNPVVGVVSRGEFTNSHGIPVLAYWPVYLPVA